ncbi:MAG: biotin--[acetyl-CoA-carboxylase] ligase [Bacteroidales bacterium]|jgi:BirA family transcriptional regulator, biotin operon repressor / biotin---[acetyl-CoA-carboxylase] ligase|nr:biotin--[acetyl-CoA-carboxylase] ligase [Bacteroidales bacterium]
MNPIIRHLEETTSTNTYLQEWIVKEEVPEGSVVTARIQTQGRGQAGNKWSAEQGKNLTFSMVLYPTFVAANEQFIISQITALAVKEALSRYVSDISIKWPNDIYYRDQKITGILIENNLTERVISSSILGIGININQQEFPDYLPNPVSLIQIIGKEVSIQEVLDLFVAHIGRYYEQIRADKESVRIQYFDSLYRNDGLYAFYDMLRKEEIRGSILSVEPNGILRLQKEDGEIRSYWFKEVQYIL